MLCHPVLRSLFGGMFSPKRRRRPPREVAYGDVVCVKDDFLKRFGIWTGEAFIQYAKNQKGRRVVHEVSFSGFLQGAAHLSICEFPKRYGRPREREQPVSSASVVAPPINWWRIMETLHKTEQYKRYTPEETVRRARSRLGDSGFLTSEHFAMWCKTGISESHQLNALEKIFDRMVVY